jgi:hypothetical protein
MDRIPSSEVVHEGKNKYVVYTCRVCHHKDIERWTDRPRPKIWDGKSFLNSFDEDMEDHNG